MHKQVNKRLMQRIWCKSKV